jgi:hypothetical protein
MVMKTSISSSRLSHSDKLSSTSANDLHTLQVVTFGRNRYRLASTAPNWYQKSPDDAAECSRCGATLTFCFAARLNKAVSGLAASSVLPIGVRCDCYLARKEIGNSMSDYTRLTRQPVPITPEIQS